VRFGPTTLDRARGGILAHSVRLPDGSVLRKGRVVGDSELDALRRAGLADVTVALPDPSDVSEDEAALEVARALAGFGVEVGKPGTGRCNLLAGVAGLVSLDPLRVRRVNEIDERVTVATLEPDAPVLHGDVVATVKVIPYAVPREVVSACGVAARGDGGGAVRVDPFRSASVALVQTVSEGATARLDERTESVLRHRVERCGGQIVTTTRCRHGPEEVAGALREAVAAGHDLVLLVGVSAVCDRGDVFPLAVERVGGEVLRLGIPVDPGNLLMLARHGGTPVLGVPGCARSPRRNGFDWILERILAGRAPEALDIPGMGVGGLLKEPPDRPHPRRPRRAPRRPRARIGGVVLAAGRSSRMGEANKLLAEVGGVPMVRRVVRTVLDAELDPVVVVVGHDAERVRSALEHLPVRFVSNPDYAVGISTSVRAGVRALVGDAEGAMIVLGDMPWISEADLRALVAAFGPDQGRGICAPVAERKRGNPVLWSARYFDELQTLEGDVGARHLLSVHDEDVCEVSVPGRGVLDDIDTPEALTALGTHEG